MTPSPILYQPKILKSCFLTKSIKNLTVNKEITNAVTVPINKYPNSGNVNAPNSKINFKVFKRLAPAITGIARKKVNSAPAGREMPSSKAAKIVIPDLDVPGIIART